MPRHLLDLFDLSSADAERLLGLASRLKRGATRPQLLTGKTLGLIFEKPSLRTRVSFEAAIAQLGGNALFLKAEDVGLGGRESLSDFARVISQYLDVLAVRSHRHATVAELARFATVPIVNALSDEAHPCQALADLLTVEEEIGRREGTKLVFVGDGNNVARSLAVACALLGAEFVHCGPEAYGLPEAFRTRFAASFPGRPLVGEPRPAVALEGADVVYTDVWASMGQEREAEERAKAFAPYQVNASLMRLARPGAVFMHCLPAHRGHEVTDEVMDGPQGRTLPQAANRLHLQKALLAWLLDVDAMIG